MGTKTAVKTTEAQKAVIEEMTKGYRLYSLLTTDIEGLWSEPHEFGGTLQGTLKSKTITIPTIKGMLRRELIKETRRYRVTDDLWHIDYELVQQQTPQTCPFCPLMGIDESLYEEVGNNFFGDAATIGNIPSCDSCATVATMTDTADKLVAQLAQQA